MYKNQWVEVASFSFYGQAYYYANKLGFTNVKDSISWNYYYKEDCYSIGGDLYSQNIDTELDNETLKEKYNMVKCDNCGALVFLDDCVQVEDYYYCDSDCAEQDGCYYCEDCETWYRDDDYYRTGEGRTICSSCYDNNYFTCEDCGDIFHNDYGYSDDWGDYMYCESCWESHDRGIINGYHDSDRCFDIQKTEEDTDKDATFGTEVETECQGNYSRKEVAETIDGIVNNKRELFIFEEDGSLSNNGYETISYPFTMRWFKQNKDLFKTMFDKMVSMGCRSHDTKTCGYHIHFGRHFFENKQESCIDRLVYLFEKYKSELEVFSRRKDFYWCAFPSNRTSCDNWKDIKEVKKIDKDNLYGHQSAINLENYETIEIRIFRGTLKFDTYVASLELVDNIIHYVKDKTDEEVEKGSFSDIVNYQPTEYLKQYCLDRNII